MVNKDALDKYTRKAYEGYPEFSSNHGLPAYSDAFTQIGDKYESIKDQNNNLKSFTITHKNGEKVVINYGNHRDKLGNQLPINRQITLSLPTGDNLVIQHNYNKEINKFSTENIKFIGIKDGDKEIKTIH
jgi:hypothetical protein